MKNLTTTCITFLIFSGIIFSENINIAIIPEMVNKVLDNSSNYNDFKLNNFQDSTQILASVAYGFSSTLDSTISMPIPTGQPLTLLAPFNTTGSLSSMCKGGDGNYYVIEFFYLPPIPNPNLYSFNTNTGELNLVGNILGLNGEFLNGIAYNPANNDYFLCSDTSLYSFDINSLTATYLGSFGIVGGSMADLCFDSNGICYAIDMGVDNAYTLDINTAETTLLGPLGYSAYYGQGMSYDFETQTIYLSAFNIVTHTGQLRTMNPESGYTSLVVDWGYVHIAPFAIDSDFGIPCSVGKPSNPNPANGSTGISINDKRLMWINGINTSEVEVWFGLPGSLEKIYDGEIIETFNLDSLSSQTTYFWRIICKDDQCSNAGPIWSFTTEYDSSIVFLDTFENLDSWTNIGPHGWNNWNVSNSNSANGSSPTELRLTREPVFGNFSRLISSSIDSAYHYIVRLKHMCNVPSPNNAISMGLSVTYDDGITKQILWEFSPSSGNIGPEEIETGFYPQSSNFKLMLYFEGFTFYLNYWSIDDIMVIDDCLPCFPPASPSNLNVYNQYYLPPRISLHWTDNSWNEEGFLIIRKNDHSLDSTEYVIIDTCVFNSTTYVDSSVSVDSTYTYRIIAFNQYGYSDSSNVATITVIPLPVELISFNAHEENNNVLLNWSTASELNNYGFEIERSSDETDWRTIGFREGYGTTTEPQDYSYIDDLFGVNAYKLFYRLKQIDFDGTFEYSALVEVDLAPLTFALHQNYPNPFNPSTKISWQSPVGSRQTLKVFDVLGREVATLVDEYKEAGYNEIEFNASELASGIYYYQLKAGDYVETKKMIYLK